MENHLQQLQYNLFTNLYIFLFYSKNKDKNKTNFLKLLTEFKLKFNINSYHYFFNILINIANKNEILFTELYDIYYSIIHFNDIYILKKINHFLEGIQLLDNTIDYDELYKMINEKIHLLHLLYMTSKPITESEESEESDCSTEIDKLDDLEDYLENYEINNTNNTKKDENDEEELSDISSVTNDNDENVNDYSTDEINEENDMVLNHTDNIHKNVCIMTIEFIIYLFLVYTIKLLIKT
jgi:hypothetical protein